MHTTDAERGGRVKTERTGGIQVVPARGGGETKGAFVPLWLPVAASEWEVNLELEEQEVLILLEESFKVQ